MTIFDRLKYALFKMLSIDNKMHNQELTTVNKSTIYDKYNIYDAWAIADANILENTYKQYISANKNTFWASVPEKNFSKRTTGLSKVILDSLVNIIAECYNNIIIDDEKNNELWKNIEIDNNFFDLLISSIRDVLIFGDGAFKLTYDPEFSKYPILDFVPAKKCNIEYEHRQPKKITFFDKQYIDNNGNIYILNEIYEKGKITYELTNEQNQIVNMENIEELRDLEPVYFSDPYFLAAIPFKFFDSSKYENHGASIYESKLDILDALDEVFSSYCATIRYSIPKLVMSEDCFSRDEAGNVQINDSIFSSIFSVMPEDLDNSNRINLYQSALNSEEYGKTISQLIALLCSNIISLSTINIELDNNIITSSDSGAAVREREKQTLYTVNKIKNGLYYTLPKLVSTTIRMYYMLINQACEITEKNINIDFSEYANPSFESKIETLKKAVGNYDIISFEKIVDELYGYTLTDKEKQEEIKKLYILNKNVTSIDELIKKDNINENTSENTDENTKEDISENIKE